AARVGGSAAEHQREHGAGEDSSARRHPRQASGAQAARLRERVFGLVFEAASTLWRRAVIRSVTSASSPTSASACTSLPFCFALTTAISSSRYVSLYFSGFQSAVKDSMSRSAISSSFRSTRAR